MSRNRSNQDRTGGSKQNECDDIIKQNHLFTMALGALPHPFYLIDAEDYTVLMDNTRAAVSQPIERRKCYEISHRRSSPCHYSGESCPLKIIRSTNEPTVVEHRHFDAEGKENFFEVHGYPVFDADGRVSAIIEYSLNITDRKQSERRQELTAEVLARLNNRVGAVDVIKDIVMIIKDFTGFDAIGIRLRKGDDFPYYEAAGFPPEFIEMENSLCVLDEEGQPLKDGEGNPVLECMCGNIIQGRTDSSQPFFTRGGSFWTNSTSKLLASTTEKERQARTRNRCHGEGYESVALIPLRTHGEAIGLLQLNDRRPDRFTLEMIEYFEGIGASVGIALARRRAEEAVHKARAELEERVRQRTAELADINEQLLTEIDFRKRVEETLRKTSRALKVLSQCNMALVRSKTETALLTEVCKVIVGVGRYRLAWVGYAEPDEKKSVRPVAQAGFEEGYLEKLELTWADTERGRGPTGRAIRTGKPATANEMQTDPKFAPWREEALKRGYASSIALPLKDGRKSFGSLNIYASEPDSFNASETDLLVELAEDLAFGIATVRTRVERERTAAALHYRLRFEQLIANLSTRFINLRAEEIEPGIDRAIKEIGEFADVDRSYIFEFSADMSRLHNTYEWCAGGIAPQIGLRNDLPAGDYPWAVTTLKRLDTVRVPDFSHLPSNAVPEQKAFTERGVKSVVLVPMACSGELLGFVGFETTRQKREWDDDTVALLRFASDMFGNTIARSRTESELRTVNERLRADQKALAEKNIAMREVLARFEDEKQAMRRQITTNVQEALLPLLLRVKQESSKNQQKLIELLEQYLRDIASPFADTLKSEFSKLTPRELEICQMIKAGQPSKDIAAILNVSLLTVHKHREQIRKKLGLKNSNVNLNSYLQYL